MTSNYQVMDRTIIIEGNLHELVRGEEQRLVKELQPIVRAQSVTFDMRHIDEMGMRHTMELALATIDAQTHLHVSFDVDFLDADADQIRMFVAATFHA